MSAEVGHRRGPGHFSYKPPVSATKQRSILSPRACETCQPACGLQSFPPFFLQVSPVSLQTKPQTFSASPRTPSIQPSTQPNSFSSSSLLLGNLIASNLLSLLAYTAFSRCGHCKALAPHYEEAATALKERKIPVAKVDCVDQPDLCQKHGVTGYP